VSPSRAAACLAAALAAAFVPALAHEGPEVVIAALTRAMDRRGPSPELLYRRACEYRVQGDLAAAEADLTAAAAADPAHFDAALELARVRLARGRHRAAEDAIAAAEPFAESDAEKAACLMARSAAARAAGDPAAAAAACDAACRLCPGEAEWVLLRSRLQAALGRHGERVRDLAAAAERNPSAAVAVELVEAKIDARLFAEVLDEVEAGLAASRRRASWLLRRGRALAGLGRQAEAASDLRSAVDEIDGRLSPGRPDAALLAERALALALLGEDEAARADLAAAEAAGADTSMTRRVTRVLAAGSSPGPRPDAPPTGR
jgi:SWI/SNF-related matrix-associated actin-dependent regulator 1 of chromatin subfamily A